MQISRFNNIKSEYIQNNSRPSFRAGLYAQKPDTFTRTTPISFEGALSKKEQNYNNVIKSLTLTNDNAQFALEGQIASDGWAGKTADWISGAWNSKNRAHLVKADIEVQRQQVKDLEASIKQGKFEEKFEDIFGVKYNQEAIDNYAEKADDFKLAVTTKCMADITKEKIGKQLKQFKENKGELKDVRTQKVMPYLITGANPLYTVIIKKEDTFNDLKEGLIDLLGSEERLNKLVNKNGFNTEKDSMEKLYKGYGAVADYLYETSKSTAEKCRDGKDLEQLKEEYENAYTIAYGDQNDIQERVDKYNRSQEIGAAAVRGVVRAGMLAATVATIAPATAIGSLAVGAAGTFSAKMIAEVTDKMTNDIDNSIDLSSKNVRKMLRSSAISSADYIASGGLKKIIPGLSTSSEILNSVVNTGISAGISTTTGIIGEYYKQGNWNTKQIIPRLLISATFSKLGADNAVVKQLSNMAKGGVQQAMKKCTRDYDTVREFVNGTKIMLDEEYTKDPEKYGSLKLLATKHPEMYDEYMCVLLDAEIERQNEKSKEYVDD